MERRLAAILATDVAELSHLLDQDEEATLGRLKSDLDVIGRLIDEHNGRVFKSGRDGVLAEFVSPVEALRCAVNIQENLNRQDADLAGEDRLRFTIGISLGDVMVVGDALEGDDVNIAAHLEAFAEPGGICVSGDTYGQVSKRVDFSFQNLGERRFRDVAEPVHVYRVVMQPEAEGGGPLVKAEPSEEPDKASIVVLPFDNLSGDPEQEYFCDGLTQDITTDLSRFANLFVIAANSAFAYKGRHTKAQDISRELNVRYLLEGSVQKAANRIRVAAQLIDASSGHHIWAERFDRSADDLFEMQDEIIQMIVAALAVEVDVAERWRVLRRPTENLSAYEIYLRGVHLFSWETEEDLANSARLFEQATELDPNFSRAWGYLAYSIVRGVLSGWRDAGDLDKARALAEKAVQLDPHDCSNHWDLAYVHLNSGRFDQALHEYEKAVELNPNDADLLVDMAETLAAVGRCHEAITQVKRAMRLNPQIPDWYRWVLSWGYFNARQYTDAIEEVSQMIKPQNDVNLLLAAAYAHDDNVAEAANCLGRFIERHPDYGLDELKTRVRFLDASDESHWLSGLQKAGLGA